MKMTEITEYLNYTVGIAGIVGIITVVKIFVKYISNHMSEVIKSNAQLTGAIQQMLRFLERK